MLLNYDGGDTLRLALGSVVEQTRPPDEIVLVDNGSQDGSLASVDDVVSDHGIHVIRLEENLGYAAGMNRGVAECASSAIVPMNCDAVLHPVFIERALEELRCHPQVGMVGAQVFRWEPGDSPLFEAGCPIDGGPMMLTRAVGVISGSDASSELECFKPNGACPVLRREMIDNVACVYGPAPFDPVFDTYYEDVDLAFKALSLGWTTRYVPALKAAHVRSFASHRSVSGKRGRLRTNVIAGRYRNALRHLPWRDLLAAVPILLMMDLGFVVARLLRRDWGVLVDVTRGWLRISSELTAILRLRRRTPRSASNRLGDVRTSTPFARLLAEAVRIP